MKNLKQYITEKLKLDAPSDYPGEYFYHEALENGYTTRFTITENILQYYSIDILQYSIDNCISWHELKRDIETPEINKGERIYFKRENTETSDDSGIGKFKSNKKFNIGGNIMSLIYGDDFEGQTGLLENGQFKYLFYENEYLVSAKDLILPAIELTEECYNGMFSSCTTLAKAPELPATELAEECYKWMFSHCISLTETPELPTTKLVKQCYCYMFYSCKSLNKITMLATDRRSADYCLHEWVTNISKTGTFIKAKDVKISFGYNGIPKGWTVKEI